MLINLVDNALDAVGPREGGEVRVTARPRDNDRVEIKVIDNGCGIAAEHLPKLFSPFFTTKELGKGTGLGLAIAYGIVMMHSGNLTVESELNHGSAFTMILPIEAADAGKSPSA